MTTAVAAVVGSCSSAMTTRVMAAMRAGGDADGVHDGVGLDLGLGVAGEDVVRHAGRLVTHTRSERPEAIEPVSALASG